ncbi:MAG: hypothetical protein ACTHQQ_08395 [Solirubrobacteraceae bacterium]
MAETADEVAASSAGDEETRDDHVPASSAEDEKAKDDHVQTSSAENEETKYDEAPASSAEDEKTKDDQAPASSPEDEKTKDDQAPGSSPEDEKTKDDEDASITELLVQLGRDVSLLVFCDAQLAAFRNLPEVRRTARDIAGALIAALAFLTAFVFANVAALHALMAAVSPWLAALVLCAAWLVLGSALVLALTVRAGRVTGWRWWRVFRAGPEESMEDLERARADAEQAVRESLMELAPAMTVEIASASVAVAGDVAGSVVEAGGDTAADAVEAGGDLLEASDDIVESMTDDLPAGSVVNQVWDIVLMPGRFGVKAATTVFRRADSHD